MKHGRYIVIEGLDGSGKSTQHQLLLDHFSDQAVGVREPGGTAIGEALRTLIKNPGLARTARTNTFLFATARAELTDTVIRPAIMQGKYVIADRNWLSTIAYQTAEGFDKVADIHTLSKLAMGELFMPDMVIFLDADPVTCQQRLHGRGQTDGDYFDRKGIGYFEQVRQNYLAHLADIPHHCIIDGNQPVANVTAAALAAIGSRFEP